MPGKIEALAILFVLLPGFTCAYITQQLAARRVQTEVEKVIEAVILSFVLYLITLPFFGYTLPLSWQVGSDGSYRVTAHFAQLLTLLIVSIALGILYAASINHDWLMSLLRKARVTERTARTAIWNDAFQELSGFVQVGSKDGSQLLGWVRYYSDDAGDPSLFLEQAAWVDGDREVPIDGPGILVTKDSGIETVTFLSWTTPQEAEAVVPEGDESL
jgi:hypothetical protein